MSVLDSLAARADVLGRKLRQLHSDPVLRRWLAHRIVRGREVPNFSRSLPPYLSPCCPFPEGPPSALPGVGAVGVTGAPGSIAVHGRTLQVPSDRPAALFDQPALDLETRLALHRFAWLPALVDSVEPGAVAALWLAWMDAHGTPSNDWTWHPYTAAERLCNLLDFFFRHGIPEPVGRTLAVLSRHGPEILARLEYYGEEQTSNHLANNGRGLYRLGLALGDVCCRKAGYEILVREAERMLGPSGMLREGSSHYQLIVARWYLDCWLAGRANGVSDDEGARLALVAERMLGAARVFALPGGLPLIGDVSPDFPPSFVAPLIDVSASGWPQTLSSDARCAVAVLGRGASSPSDEVLGADGWRRIDRYGWSLLCHGAPDGWSRMPGHGHQDLGGFELHDGATPLVVDPGRGAYGDEGEAGFYKSARAHNGVTVDGADPYPANRPYYGPDYRRRVGGPAPKWRIDASGLELSHQGFGRLKGVQMARRRWMPGPDRLEIEDQITGTGRHLIERRLHTTRPLRMEDDGVLFIGGLYRLTVENGVITLEGRTRWTAYAEGHQATAIVITAQARLPWSGRLVIERGQWSAACAD